MPPLSLPYGVQVPPEPADIGALGEGPTPALDWWPRAAWQGNVLAQERP